MIDTIDPFQTNEQVNYLDEVTKKFNKDGQLDVEGLARGKFEADKHIAKLEAELADQRKKAEQGVAMKDLLDAIKGQNGNVVEPTPSNPPQDTAANPVDVEALVRETLVKSQNEQREVTNKNTVVAKLNEVWGNQTAVKLQEASTTLGISVKELENMGKQSPVALFQLLGINTPPRPGNGSTVPTSTVQIGGGKVGVRNKRYYDELYKSNPKLRNDSKVTSQEMRDAIEQGEAFFN